MNFNDKVVAVGCLRLVLTDERGRVKIDKVASNTIVNAGKSTFASRLIGVVSAIPSHILLGTSGTGVTSTDVFLLGTNLGNQAVGSAAQNNINTFTATFAAGNGTGSILEAALTNGITAAASALSYTRSGGTITVTKNGHGLSNGRAVGIAAATDTANNGGWTVTNSQTNTFDLVTGAAGADGTLTLYQDAMIARTTFGLVTKGAGDTLACTWTVTFT